jgi:hypothetical protein
MCQDALFASICDHVTLTDTHTHIFLLKTSYFPTPLALYDRYLVLYLYHKEWKMIKKHIFVVIFMALLTLFPHRQVAAIGKGISAISKLLKAEKAAKAVEHLHPDAHGKINPKSLIGKIIEEKGYLSTSTKREIAENFESCIMREIRVPSNAKCTDISGISYFSNDKTAQKQK